jgi:exonuclease III
MIPHAARPSAEVPYDCTVRIATWNVRMGGRHDLKGQIADAVGQLRADVVVITEAKKPSPKGDLARELSDRGWIHQIASPLADLRSLGVLVVSRTPIQPVLDLPAPAHMPYRQVAFRVEGFDMDIVGLYMPPMSERNMLNTPAFWRHLLAHAPQWTDRPLMLIGDTNSGCRRLDERQTGILPIWREHEALLDRGFVDAYRCLNPSGRASSWWWPSGAGMRIDHCLVSSGQAHRLRFAAYVTGIGPTRFVQPGGRGRSGMSGLSDHAAMIVDFDRTDQR